MATQKKFLILSVITLMLVISAISFTQGMHGMGDMMGMGWGTMPGPMAGMGMGGNRMGTGWGMSHCPMMNMTGVGMGMNGMGMMDVSTIDFYLYYADYLGLSETQIDKLKERRTEYLNDSIDKRSKLQQAWVDIQYLLDNDDVDISKVEKKIRSNQGIMADLMVQNVKAQVDARNILTPAQRLEAEKYYKGYGWHSGTK